MSDEAIVALLEELLAWTRFANREALVRTWEKVLTDEKHLKAYELTDGRPSRMRWCKSFRAVPLTI